MELTTDTLFAYIGLLYVEKQEVAKENAALKRALADKAEAKGYVDVPSEEQP